MRAPRAVFVLLPFLACAPPETPVPDFTSNLPAADTTPSTVLFEVTWKDSTVRIPAAQAMASLTAVPPDGEVYRFRAPLPPQLGQVAAGKHLLLEGIGLFKILEVNTPADGTVAVRTEPGSLLEATESGRVDIDMNLPMEGGVGGVGFPGVLPQPLPDGWTPQMPGPISAEFGYRMYKLKYSAAPKDSGYEVTFEGSREPDASGGAVKFTSTSMLRNLRAVVRAQWNNGQFTGPGLLAIKGSVAGRARATVSALSGTLKLKVPVKYVLPFSAGPVPMFVMLQAALEMTTTIERKDDKASGEVTFFWSGETGFKVDPGSSWVPGSNNREGATETGGSAATTTVPNVSYTYGLGFVNELRVDLGTGLLKPAGPSSFDPFPEVPAAEAAARASLYGKFKAESVVNFSVKRGNSGNCLTTTSNAGLFLGGELKLLNVGLQLERQAWGATKTKKQPMDCN